MIVLDTTVLVYAKGSEHPLRDPCRRLIEAIADGRLDGATTVEVIQEFVHVRAQRRGRSDAVELATAYADLLSPLLTANGEHLRDGMSLFERNSALASFDAVLASVALHSDAGALVSAEGAFAAVPGLRHVIPDEEGVEELLKDHT